MMVLVSVPQSCPTLCSPMDSSPPGSSVHGILQARIPERVAIPSGGLPDLRIEPRSLHLGEILYHLSHQGSPYNVLHAATTTFLLGSSIFLPSMDWHWLQPQRFISYQYRHKLVPSRSWHHSGPTCGETEVEDIVLLHWYPLLCCWLRNTVQYITWKMRREEPRFLFPWNILKIKAVYHEVLEMLSDPVLFLKK